MGLVPGNLVVGGLWSGSCRGPSSFSWAWVATVILGLVCPCILGALERASGLAVSSFVGDTS